MEDETRQQVPGISGRSAGGLTEPKPIPTLGDAQSNDGRNRPRVSILCWCAHVLRVGSSGRAIGSDHPRTTGAMEALHRVTRYLLGTKDTYIKLRVQSGDPVLVELVGRSDSEWAGDPASLKSQSSGHVDADGFPQA